MACPRQWPLALALLLAAAASSQAALAAPRHPAVAAAPAGASLTFLSVGDTGKVSEDLRSVAQQMALWRAKTDASFVMLNGDNFYENGVKGVDDPLWQSTFLDIFPEADFPTPFYAIQGNHDWRGAPTAQSDYYSKHGDAGRFTMPAPGYYVVQKQLADGTTADFFYVDTITLAPKAAEAKVLPQLPADVGAAKRAQYEWLEGALKASVARGSDWRIVAGHYPIFSAGEHGDTPELIAELLPLLERYQVDAYLCGHDHTMQHLQHRGTGVQFLVNGSGSKLGTLDHATQASAPRAAQVYFGFMVHELTKDRLTTRALDSTGRTQYVFSQSPRRRADALKAGRNPSPVVSAPAFHHHPASALPSKQQRGAASAAEGDAAFGDLPPSALASGVQQRQRQQLLRVPVAAAAAASPFAVAGGLLALLLVMAAVWRVRTRRRAQRYHSVVGSASSASIAAAAAAHSVGRGVWSDDEVEEYDSDLESGAGGEEFQVELSHLA